MRSIADALAAMMPAFSPLGEEEVALTDAAGRHVSRSVEARHDSPRFDNSAMDGYAVRASDVAGATERTPVRLPVRGESRAGSSPDQTLQPGTACRIFTGAPLPSGADAIVIQEETETLGEDVIVLGASPTGKHVRPRGSDLTSGAALLRKGDCVLAGEIGLLASQNVERIHVFRRPRVALLSTGDELRPLGATLEPGTIVNSNVYVLTEMVRELGAVPVALPAARDRLPDIESALRVALESDVVLSMGGVSVGAYDLVHEAFDRVGIERSFWKVGIKPGKPMVFGMCHAKPVIGIPGNPVSAMITFEVLIAPCLRRMLGDPRPHRQPIEATLRHGYRRTPGRVEIARGVAKRLTNDIVVTLHEQQGSGSLVSFVGVNALVVLPADRAALEPGDRVAVIPWGGGLRGERSFFESLD